MTSIDYAKLRRAIRNCSYYWFARIIRGDQSRAAIAFACGIHPAERLAVSRTSKARTYWRLRHQGLSGLEAMAHMNGVTVPQQQANNRKKWQAYRQKWGGAPVFGTPALRRRLLDIRSEVSQA